MLSAAMSCGAGVQVCGVLALMTGLGSGMQNVTGGAVYGHPTPVVHGLWPQTPPFGDSACVAPSAGASNATRVYPCYQCARPSPGVVDTNCSGVPHHSPSEFQDHEWSKHGVCAGVRDAQDYLTQVCTLAAPPLRVLSAARSAGTTSLDRFKALLEVNLTLALTLALALTRTRTRTNPEPRTLTCSRRRPPSASKSSPRTRPPQSSIYRHARCPAACGYSRPPPASAPRAAASTTRHALLLPLILLLLLLLLLLIGPSVTRVTSFLSKCACRVSILPTGIVTPTLVSIIYM